LISYIFLVATQQSKQRRFRRWKKKKKIGERKEGFIPTWVVLEKYRVGLQVHRFRVFQDRCQWIYLFVPHSSSSLFIVSIYLLFFTFTRLWLTMKHQHGIFPNRFGGPLTILAFFRVLRINWRKMGWMSILGNSLSLSVQIGDLPPPDLRLWACWSLLVVGNLPFSSVVCLSRWGWD
jgi:hypothetical protein